MTKEQARDAIVKVLAESGLDFDNQVKAISMARVAIQPRVSDWRGKAKMIERPSGGIMSKSKRQSEPSKEKK